MSVRLEPDRLRPERELEEFVGRLSGDGAVVTFVGIARPKDRNDRPVTGLHLDHYTGMTEASLFEIAADARRRFEVSDIAVVHRCGEVSPGGSDRVCSDGRSTPPFRVSRGRLSNRSEEH